MKLKKFKDKFTSTFQYSSSKWETSHFGGYYSVIWDHPDVVIDYQVDIKINEMQGLTWFTANKLMKMFLLKVNENKLIPTIIKGADIKERVRFFRTEKYIEISPIALNAAFSLVCTSSPEHINLFQHYKKLILSTEITMPVDPSTEHKAGSSKEEGAGEGEDDKDSKEDKDKKDGGKKGEKKDSEDGEDIGEGDEETEGDSTEEGEDGESNDGDINISPSLKKKPKNHSGKENPIDDEFEPLEEKELEKPKEEKTSARGYDDALEDLRKILAGIQKRETIHSNIAGDWKGKTKFRALTNVSKTTFQINEIQYASRLVQMLDINFDPSVDRINSLRTGKLDPRKVAEVVPGNTNVYYLMEENQTTKPFSVCILCDESGSMGGADKIYHQKRIVKTLYLAFSEIIPEDKLFIYGHSGGSTPEIYIYQDKYENKFEERIEQMCARSSNYDGPVIEEVYEKVRSFTDDNIIFIVLSDGQPAGDCYGGSRDVEDMKRIIEKCRRDGYVTLGVGILHFSDPGLYNYSCVINDLDDEAIKKVSHLVNKVVKTEFQ